MGFALIIIGAAVTLSACVGFICYIVGYENGSETKACEARTWKSERINELTAELADAIKERDELNRQLEVMDDLNRQALNNSAKWKREFDRADYAIDRIVCALESYHAET